MKKIPLILLIISSVNCLAQDNSDLYQHIDSLIQYDLQYVYDSTTDQLPKNEWDSTKTITPHFSTFSANPSPLIILNGQRVNRTDLNKYKLSQIANIDLYEKEDIKMQALYGSSSDNGVILIQTNRFQRKNNKNK